MSKTHWSLRYRHFSRWRIILNCFNRLASHIYRYRLTSCMLEVVNDTCLWTSPFQLWCRFSTANIAMPRVCPVDLRYSSAFTTSAPCDFILHFSSPSFKAVTSLAPVDLYSSSPQSKPPLLISNPFFRQWSQCLMERSLLSDLISRVHRPSKQIGTLSWALM